MATLVQVQVGEYRPTFVFDPGALEVRRGDRVVIELDRGLEHGRVVAATIPGGAEGRGFSVQGRIVRKTTEADQRQIETNRGKARGAITTAISKASELKLDMKMLIAEISFDGSKVIFYFTAEGRVDFRELVKELARTFRARIELKQIGVRDRARVIGGYGVCGQPLCCSGFIKDFSQLSIKMAKEQALPLNPSKVNGVCDRVKCCMAYEVGLYRELNKGLPKMGARVQAGDVRGRVTGLDVLKRLVSVDLGDGRIAKVTVPADGGVRELEEALRAQVPPPRPERRGPDRGPAAGPGRPETSRDQRPERGGRPFNRRNGDQRPNRPREERGGAPQR